MKKQIFTLLFLSSIYGAYAQNQLKDKISASGGISNHFTTLTPQEQVVFNPKAARDVLGLDPSSDLVISTVETDRVGFSNYRYIQTYRGLPVENTMMIAHVKAGKLTGVSGQIITQFDNTIQQRKAIGISAKQAIDKAIQYVNAVKFAWQDADMENSIKQQKEGRTTYFPTASLVWFSNEDNIRSRDLRVAYKVDVYAREPLSRAYYFVDAQTGNVLGKKDELFFSDATGTAATAYSGSQTIHSDLSGSSYRLRDYTKGAGILTYHGESGKRGTDYTSTSANWSLTGTNIAALDAHYGVSQTYAFYYANFNRNSYDNQGTALKSYVNDPTYTDNAFWDGTAMNFNKRSSSTTNPGGVTGIDVTGHELTHGVTQATSGLNYSKEPGAMNESMSDIMGKSVQFWSKPNDINWTLSNDMNWIIRSFSNPNSQGQPDTYKGTYWVTTSGDSYGVHTNSGVGNFMFYLLVTGGSGTNDIGNAYTVQGIGLDKADQILYRTNTVYLTPTSQYADWRQACINAAGDLYPGDATVLAAVQNAWYAVGVGAAAGGGTTCNTPAGLTATNITTSSAQLNWAASGATTYNLQWKASSASAFTTIAGISGTTYNLTGLTAATTYQFKIQGVCAAANSSYSAVKSFTTSTGGTTPYCASSGITTYEYIAKIALGTISNTSNNNNGYGDYTSLNTTLAAGASNSIVMTPGYTGTAYAEYWSVYIDYNQDGDFADAGERVATGNGKVAITKAFTVPTTAKNGATRMRVQMKYGSPASSDPCATFTNGGEVEDYTVTITGGAAVSAFSIVQVAKPMIQVNPNPATIDAAIVYTIPNQGKVTIQIIDMFGRAVQTIAQGNKSQGTYTLPLSGVKRLAAGTYMITVLQNNVPVAKSSFITGK